MSRASGWLASIAALAGVAIPAAAHADSVLVAVATNDGDIGTESLVRTAAEEKALGLRYNIIAADVAAQRGVALDRIPGCLERDTACMKALVAPAGANRVLLLVVDRGVDSAGARWLVVGRLIDGVSGELVVSSQRTCESCSADKLPPTVEEITVELLGRDPAQVDVVPPRLDYDAPPPRPYRLWKWVALGAGVASVATGVAFIAMDEDAVVDGAQQPTERNTAPVGYVLVGVGAALAVTGGILWLMDTGSARGGAAALEPVEGGAVVTWSGRF